MKPNTLHRLTAAALAAATFTACTTSEPEALPEASLTTQAPTTTEAPTTVAPTTEAPTTTEPAPTTTAEPTPEQIATETLENFYSLFGDENPTISPDLLGAYATGELGETLSEYMTREHADGSTWRNGIVLLDLEIVEATDDLIHVSTCARDDVEQLSAEGEVSLAPTGLAYRRVYDIVFEDGSWKVATQLFEGTELTEC